MAKASPETILWRLREALTGFPVLEAASAPEPWVKVRFADFKALFLILDGEDPAEWVSEFCGAEHSHLGHHYSSRVTDEGEWEIHFCSGEPIG